MDRKRERGQCVTSSGLENRQEAEVQIWSDVVVSLWEDREQRVEVQICTPRAGGDAESFSRSYHSLAACSILASLETMYEMET